MQVGDSVELKDGTKGKILVVHPTGRQVYVELEDTRRITEFSTNMVVIEPAADEAAAKAAADEAAAKAAADEAAAKAAADKPTEQKAE
jgi:hypothetical protein